MPKRFEAFEKLQAAGIIKMDGRTIAIPELRALEAEIEAGE